MDEPRLSCALPVMLGLLAGLFAVGAACSSRGPGDDVALHDATAASDDSVPTADDAETRGESGDGNPYPDARCSVFPNDFSNDDCPSGSLNTAETSAWTPDICWAGLATVNLCHVDADCPHAGVVAEPRCVPGPRDDLCHLVCDATEHCPMGMECLLSRHGFHACYWVARSPLPRYLWSGGCPQSGDGILCETDEDCAEGMECHLYHSTGDHVCYWPD
jgi:hypothetical protein